MAARTVILLRTLDRHWFAPARSSDLAIARMVVVGSQLLLFLPDLADQIWLAGADPSLFRPIPALKVLMFPFGEWGARPDLMLLRGAWLLAIVSGVTGVLGLYTRPSMLAFAATNTLLVAHGYSYGEFHHPEGLLIIALWLLAVAPSGAVLSADDLRTRLAGSLQFMKFQPRRATDEYSESARWPLRTIQWLFVLAYLSAGLSKLRVGGLEWMNGHTLAYYLLQDGVRWDIPLAVALAEWTWLLVVLSVVTVAFEMTFAVAVVVPRLVWPYVLVGAALHTGIYFTQRAPFFQYMVLYVVFLEALRLHFPLRKLLYRSTSSSRWTVIYDGLCPRCIRTMVVLDYADVRGRLVARDFEAEWPQAAIELHGISQEEARHSMHVVTPEGTTYRGYHAFGVLARVLPGLWPLLPLFYLPFAGRIGPRIYDQLAARRSRICTVATCGRAAARSLVLLVTAVAIDAAPLIAQNAPRDPLAGWQLERGVRLQVDVDGFQFPASLAFVPNPGPGPKDPLYFVIELRGTVKVVTNDRSVHVFAERATDYTPTEALPRGRDSQAGAAGICVAPEQGYVFVTFAKRDAGGVLRNGIVRFSSEPHRFGLKAGDRFDLPLLDAFESGVSHQIGNCRVERGRLYVGVGDGWQPYLAGDPTKPNGKLLRMGLSGEALPDNPFQSGTASGVQGQVLAIGLRNPFGVSIVSGRVFVADNGARVDRFVSIKPGHDYQWRGSDLAIGLGADFVFTPSIGPAEMDYAPSTHDRLPTRLRETFYIASSGNTALGGPPGVVALRWSEASGTLVAPSRWVVRAAQSVDQIVAAVSVGPDGIYFAPLMPLGAEGSPVLKLVPDGDGDWARGVVAVTPRQLMVETGCVGCHVLDDDWGFGSNIGPPLDGRGVLSARLNAFLNSEEYVRSLSALDERESHAAWADARRDVLAATGNERVKRWIKHRIMEPRFDRLVSMMPTLQVPEREADIMASYLAGPPPVLGVRARMRAIADRVLPAENVSRRTVATFFLAGIAIGGGAVGIGALLLQRTRRRRP